MVANARDAMMGALKDHVEHARQLKVRGRRLYSAFSVAAVLAHHYLAAKEVQVLLETLRSCMRLSFLVRGRECCPLVCILRDTLSDLLRTLYDQAMFDFVNPVLKIR